MPLEACNLGSVNLAKFVVGQRPGPGDRLRGAEGRHRLVGALPRQHHRHVPVPAARRSRTWCAATARSAWASWGSPTCSTSSGIPYNSEEALQAAGEVMRFIQEASHETSQALAEERGVFANWERSVFKDKGIKLRNATTTTIAPTGTLSIIAGCSSGIEPLFALSFVRTVMDNDKLMEVNPVFEKRRARTGASTARSSWTRSPARAASTRSRRSRRTCAASS
ncbi:MAG: hypothetical protein MZV70_40805 [Desulfobacterales bacterium]|nr:hypothetical protein [Desulfobacterales bacterium]